ncbi:hypothetical protein LOZ59_003611 [Ophidiomyces ophidiicola]|nr:hypothetical protein LOZ59_003611 [Ophidiomyces ophidiicola]
MAASTAAAVLYTAAISTPTQVLAPEDVEGKAHHAKGGGFQNPWDSWHLIPAWAILSKLIARRFKGEANIPDTTPPTVPVRSPKFLPTRATGKLRATWLGHACYYVEFPGGLRVLFDPVFEDKCSPFSWLGPKRYTEMPCTVEDIPFIDAVVISHNHYDHLSYPTIKQIHKRHPNCQFFAPLGNKQWFTASGIHNVTELDWWEEREFVLSPSGDVIKAIAAENSLDNPPNISARIGCLPCQHISARTLWDRSNTLWASWSVESGQSKVYFAGDTGYRSVPDLPNGVDDYGPDHDYPHCPAFAQVGQYRGPFTLGLIPIGAYDPRYIMSPMHANPHDAVNIFQDTRCERALGMHWGTWVLTEEDVMEPPKKLKEALVKNNLAGVGVFDVCDIGESREF